jgi:hypothetical protein
VDGATAAQKERLRWYARRLRSMTAGEVVWRAARLAEQHVPRPSLALAPDARLLRSANGGWEHLLRDFQDGAGRPVLLDRLRAREIASHHPDQVAALIEAADRICAGIVTYFGYPEARLGSPVDWNRDAVRNVRWPLVGAAHIDHRTVKADPKWIWELNRLQHLPWLAQAWLFTDDDGYAELALAHLDSWLDQNPIGRGIAWRGAFEGGLRAVSVAVALQGLRDFAGLTPARFERVVRMLAGSAELCWKDRSRYSSANNHLVGELGGLATVAIMFPERSPGRRRRTGERGRRSPRRPPGSPRRGLRPQSARSARSPLSPRAARPRPAASRW